jgi:hypothetical protein
MENIALKAGIIFFTLKQDSIGASLTAQKIIINLLPEPTVRPLFRARK